MRVAGFGFLTLVALLVFYLIENNKTFLREQSRLNDELVLLTKAQQSQQLLINQLVSKLDTEIEGLRTETSVQIEATQQTVVATKQELESALEAQKEVSLTEVINLWRNRIAFVQCEFNFLGAIITQRGAATFFNNNNTPTLVTNRHIVEGFSGRFQSCYYRFPQDTDNIEFPENVITFGVDDRTDKPDYALIELQSPNAFVRSLNRTSRLTVCKDVPQIGDEIVVLGFPTIGSAQDVTATDGIIAAIEDEYYVTSAKVDNGNSGGAAIHVDKQCYLGIPTFTALGQAESLARILRADKIDF